MREVIVVRPDYSTPALKYPRHSCRSASIRTHMIEPGIYHANGQGPYPHEHRYRYYRVFEPLRTTNLEIDGQVWMVDDPPHWWTICEHARHYKGNVLVAGLGLGLIVHALRRNRKVADITVIERCQDVIDLVRPYVPRCKVICDDWNVYSRHCYEKQTHFDGIFFDLFVGRGENLFGAAVNEMMTMRHHFPGAKQHRILGFPHEEIMGIAASFEILRGLPYPEQNGKST